MTPQNTEQNSLKVFLLLLWWLGMQLDI